MTLKPQIGIEPMTASVWEAARMSQSVVLHEGTVLGSVAQAPEITHEALPKPSRFRLGSSAPLTTSARRASDRQIATANASIQRHPERHRARVAVKDAVRRGRLVKGPCAVGVDCCGRIEGHHLNYGKPLEVQWLCKRHHIAADRAWRAQQVAA